MCAQDVVATAWGGYDMRNVLLYKWILVDLIKPFQKSIGSMGPRRRPAEKQKVQDVRNK